MLHLSVRPRQSVESDQLAVGLRTSQLVPLREPCSNTSPAFICDAEHRISITTTEEKVKRLEQPCGYFHLHDNCQIVNQRCCALVGSQVLQHLMSRVQVFSSFHAALPSLAVSPQTAQLDDQHRPPTPTLDPRSFSIPFTPSGGLISFSVMRLPQI